MKSFSKKLFVVMLALLPCFQDSFIYADGWETIPIKEKPSNGSFPRPRSRARYIVENENPICAYCDGEVTIQAEIGITQISATVTRLEDNVTYSDTSFGDTLIMSVSTDPGTYVLTFTLSNGKSYIGEYTLY